MPVTRPRRTSAPWLCVAGAPVERQEAACLAGCRGGHLGPFHDNDIDPAATEEVGGAGADHAGAADHDAHSVSALEVRAKDLDEWGCVPEKKAVNVGA